MNQRLLQTIDERIADVLTAGFNPRYLVVGWADYADLIEAMGGQRVTKIKGLDVVVDPTQALRMDVVPRADYGVRYADAMQERAHGR